MDCVGISFLHPKTRASILPVAYFEVEKFEASRDTFDLQLEGVLYSFRTTRGLEIKDLVTVITNKLLRVTKLTLAHTDNEVEGKDALKFAKDDIVIILEKNLETGWWKGRARNKIGWFSADLVTPVVLKPKHVCGLLHFLSCVQFPTFNLVAQLHEEEKKKRAEIAAAAAAVKKAKAEEEASKAQQEEVNPKEEAIGQQFSMMNYAKMYFVDNNTSAPAPSPGSSRKSSFASKFTLGRKKEKEEVVPVNWGWTELVKKIKHSKVPIIAPLTKVFDPNENELCIELFKGLPSKKPFFFFITIILFHQSCL